MNLKLVQKIYIHLVNAPVLEIDENCQLDERKCKHYVKNIENLKSEV